MRNVLLRYLLILVLVLPTFLIIVFAGVVSGKLAYSIYAKLCKVILRILGIELRVEVHPEVKKLDSSRVYLGLNQESPLETFLWPASIPGYAKYVLNIEFALVPLIGWGFWAMRNIIIIRKWKIFAKKQLRQGVQYLRKSSKGAICIQLDGYMKSNDTLGPYKKGGIIMAKDSGSAIVPITIHGAQKCLKKGGFFVKPGIVRFNLLPPIITSDLKYKNVDEVLDDMKALAKKEFPHKQIL